MKSVIWGAGNNGLKLFRLFGTDYIAAYVDENLCRQQNNFYGLPLISLEEYKREWCGYPLIISMDEYEGLEKVLKKKNIEKYFIYRDSILSSYEKDGKTLDILTKMLMGYDKREKILICPFSLLGIWIYACLQKLGFADIGFLIDEKQENVPIGNNGYSCLFKHADKTEQCDRILLTDSKWEILEKNYLNTKVEEIYGLKFELADVSHAELRKFHNVHSDKRCFLIANGPSLKSDDLECLREHNEICFGVNMLYRGFDSFAWRPNYYVLSDYDILDSYGDDLSLLGVEAFFAPDDAYSFWERDLGNQFFSYRLKLSPDFSSDISRCIYAWGTVMHVCLQIAIYMGFSQIYLLGADTSYTPNKIGANSHFIKNYHKENDNVDDRKFNYVAFFQAYQTVQRYAKRNGIDIVNATRGGKLEIFDRVNFNDLF